MKFSALLSASLIVALGESIPLFHQHHDHVKREAVVVTIYETVTAGAGTPPTTLASTTSFDPYTPTLLNMVPWSVLEAPEDSESSAPAQTPIAYSTSSSVTSDAAETTSDATSSAAEAASTATGAAGVAANAAKGITYSPYSNSGACKTADEIQSDIAKLAGFNIIRVYAPDCSVIENILQSKSSSQKIFAGLFNFDSLSADIDTLKAAVESSGSWDDVSTVSVGNEWVNSGQYSVSQVSGAVTSARSLLSSAGYSGPIVSVDTLVAVLNNPGLCDVSDFIAVNSHPYFDGAVQPLNCGSWLSTQIDNVKSACGGSKDVLITETGWPTSCQTYGAAVPSVENQYDAVKSIVDAVGDQVFVFTMYNDYWKQPGPYGVEQSWGIFGDSA